MKNDEFIKEIQQRISKLKQERDKIDSELALAQNYLNILTSKEVKTSAKESKTQHHSNESLEKMKRSQKERQERERHFRHLSVVDYLKQQESASTAEIAEHLHLSINTVKKCLRSYNDVIEVRKDEWHYESDEMIPF